jgi:hypothetical protein
MSANAMSRAFCILFSSSAGLSFRGSRERIGFRSGNRRFLAAKGSIVLTGLTQNS